MEQTSLLDDLSHDLPEAQTGFRLARFEVLNWGTFHREIWTLPLEGQNALLTGEIGSGKSTLVDGLVTLLYPYQKITFNQAAGAKGRERNLASYVRGDYRQAEEGSLSLRNAQDHSVLLAEFYNAGLEETVCLAVVYWFSAQGDLQRFYCVSQKPLKIESHFLNFDGSIKNLTSQLRKQPFLEYFENFNDYQAHFMRLFGIQRVQALNLFYQTVSLKSIGDLTDFIRNHMLDFKDFTSDIDRLKQEFDDLEQSYQAVLKARRQQEKLQPIMRQNQRWEEAQAQAGQLQLWHNYLPVFVLSRKSVLLRTMIDRLATTLALEQAQQQEITHELGRERAELQDLLVALQSDPQGQRQVQLRNQIALTEQKRDRLKKNWDRYQTGSKILNLPPLHDNLSFERNRHTLQQRLDDIQQLLAELEQDAIDIGAKILPLKEEQEKNQIELAALAKRKTQLPDSHQILRQKLCHDLNLPENELWYIAELIQIQDSEKAWEGAIERLLHGFALSLLVPEKYYGAVLEWIEKNTLPMRLVYYRMPDTTLFSPPEMPDQALFWKLNFKQHIYSPWIQNEIHTRYNLLCSESLNEFKQLSDALSMTGQVKRGGRRHEKDDRRDLHDASYYVLGWTNQNKIAALIQKLAELDNQLISYNSLKKELQQKRKHQQELNQQMRDLLSFETFAELDSPGALSELGRLHAELAELEKSSDTLKRLQEQVNRAERIIRQLEGDLKKSYEVCGQYKAELDRAQEQWDELPQQPFELNSELEKALQSLVTEWSEPVDLNTLHQLEKHLDSELKEEQKANQKNAELAKVALLDAIGAYREAFPQDSLELARSEAAVPELQALYAQLLNDDLPSYEAKFKHLLQTETTNSLLVFDSKLSEASAEIREKIKMINASLLEIDYHPGTYIELESKAQAEPQIQTFKQDLRGCLEQSDAASSYSDERFQKVKNLIDSLAGRSPEFIENPDFGKRWRNKVTDVRQWYSYSAIEYRREDGQKREHYRDSGGKSGGQKEKLAYTILASALAFQFGLTRGPKANRSFRFVMIDEAFGKGSDESTRYALQLFKQFQLQVLVVTPRTKVAVISPFVKTILFVHNQDGERSSVSPITITELETLRSEQQ